MKKTVSFRFTPETLDKLFALARGTTRTAVLEGLVDEAFRKRFSEEKDNE